MLTRSLIRLESSLEMCHCLSYHTPEREEGERSLDSLQDIESHLGGQKEREEEEDEEEEEEEVKISTISTH